MVNIQHTSVEMIENDKNPLMHVKILQIGSFEADFFNFLFQQISSVPSQDGEQNGLMGRVDEGVDEFFSTKVTKIESK